MNKIKIPNPEAAPINRKGRLKSILKMANKQKEAFLPPIGFEFQAGPYIYKVTYHNVGDARFTAKLHDVIVEGVNDD
jgi:hypothetical protein